ncbi:hypothetical protein NM688_g2540 [Phlebia brevispora]|uniref:Uncharacterized protein n=1 Tax=Phlebia brevispora TaxID=194682 RepID=A0ACC1T8K7_9APHY|nr:hypothetical protein NM688_g2540 [Phlebia brevispora]
MLLLGWWWIPRNHCTSAATTSSVFGENLFYQLLAVFWSTFKFLAAMAGELSDAPIVLITGCSAGGLGESLALAFHAKGCRVFATSRTLSSMEQLRVAGIDTFELDVTKTESIVAARERVEGATGGKLDILVNNAGQSYPYATSDASMDKVRALFDVNFFGALEMVQAFLPLLLVSSDARIVQIGSLSGIMPTPFGVSYNTSKAALQSLSDTLRVELAPFNIKVVHIVLGNVQTPITKPWHRLPQDSLYLPIKDIYQSRRIENFMDNAHQRAPVARDIVDEALKREPRAWWWGGKNSLIIWFIYSFLPRRCLDWVLSRHFGLTKLSELRSHQRKTL